MKVFLLAGEASGDKLGAALMAGLLNTMVDLPNTIADLPTQW